MQQTLIAYKIVGDQNPSPESIIYAKPDETWYSMNANYAPIGLAHINITPVSEKDLKELQLKALQERLERETEKHSERTEPLLKLIHRLQRIG